MTLPLWLIPALPLAGFLLNGLVALACGSRRAAKVSARWRAEHPDAHGHDGHGEEHAENAHDDHAHGDHGHGHAGPFLPYWERLFYGVVGVLSVGLATVVAFANLVPYVAGSLATEGGLVPVIQTAWRWMAAGHVTIDVAFRLDALSAMMLSFVTFVGLLIHVYSVGYLQDEEGYGRYFAYLNLFMFAMLTLVLANSLPVLFIGWEGVGLCSYLLIGYYYDKDFAHAAGKKAFVTNRVGDYGMILGIFGILALFGTTDFSFVDLAKQGAVNGSASITVYAVCLLLFLGAVGKSAQVPLYVWLPDAMAGPTPVSALIHAATMVTAGVYLVARCSAVFVLAPDALTLVAWVGAATAIFAATIGLAQNDIKKVLAYSTVSQLGYMFLGCGVLAFGAGMFHVFTHAWFKACLFLGSGSVIHALSGEQEMTAMGGLRGKIPHTYRTMLISTLAIAGVPGLAGFFSKDLILGETFIQGHPFLWVLAALTAGLTAFYMFRLVKMTFFGEYRGPKETWEHVHESPATMTVPLWILAAGAVVVGWFGIPNFVVPGGNRFEAFLHPSFPALPPDWTPHPHEVSHSLEWTLMLASIAIAGVGILLATKFFYPGSAPYALPAKVVAAFPRAYRWVRNKYFVDELYEAVFVTGLVKKGGRLLWEIDARVVDGLVNGTRHLTVGFSHVSNWFDRVFVDGAVNGVGESFQAAWRGAGKLQTGQTQNYAFGMAAGVFALVCIYIIFA